MLLTFLNTAIMTLMMMMMMMMMIMMMMKMVMNFSKERLAPYKSVKDV